jgi:hemerythrin-like metal-binding protein
MPVMVWDEKYSVKVPELDAQHKRLFDMLNAFCEAIAAKQTSEAMTKIIFGLVQYAEFHIQYEERLMERYRYTGLDAQRAAHAAFVQKMTSFQTRCAEGKPFLTAEVASFANEWIADHILASDMKYVECLTSKTPLMAPLASF